MSKTVQERALELHSELKGKVKVESKVEVNTMEDLSLAYTPGVAEPCKKIAEDKELAYEYTSKGNLVAVVSDGTAVLGLGDIGPEAAMPVMEGKAVLFKKFAGIDAFPICIDTKNTDEIVNVVKNLGPTFGGINLEDISAPRCFEIERRLKEVMDIPVFHDDQHGTAIVVLAAIYNSLKLVNKKIEDIKLVLSGAGSAGIAITKLLMKAGLKNAVLVDRKGALCEGEEWLTETSKIEIAKITNPNREKASLQDVIKGADVFIGVSAPGVLTTEMVKTMAKDAIVFAMANPVPEIYPEDAIAGGAKIVGTGRSDFPNQVNNVLAFPGIFRGALDVRAKDITDEMKLGAAKAIADVIKEEELAFDYVIPKAFNLNVARAVALEVGKIALRTNMARKIMTEEELEIEIDKNLN